MPAHPSTIGPYILGAKWIPTDTLLELRHTFSYSLFKLHLHPLNCRIMAEGDDFTEFCVPLGFSLYVLLTIFSPNCGVSNTVN